jgi:hypothetical protein
MPKLVTVYSDQHFDSDVRGFRLQTSFLPIFNSNAQNQHLQTVNPVYHFSCPGFKLTGPDSNYVTIGNQLITEFLFESGTTRTRETGLTMNRIVKESSLLKAVSAKHRSKFDPYVGVRIPLWDVGVGPSDETV